MKQPAHRTEFKYIRLPFDMLKNQWVTNADVIVYAIMLNRYDFFKKLGKSYFENTEDIAECSGQGIATVKRSIKKLSEHGHLQIAKTRITVGTSNNYVVPDIYGILDVKKSRITRKHTEENDSPF